MSDNFSADAPFALPARSRKLAISRRPPHRRIFAMKTIGLLALLFGFSALTFAPHASASGDASRRSPAFHSSPVAAAAQPTLRPPMVAPSAHWDFRPPSFAPPNYTRAPYGWDCNRRRFAGGSLYAGSWAGDSATAQPDAPPPEAPPPPVVNYVFVEAPAVAPPPERLGPRFIAVDRRTIREAARRPTLGGVWGHARLT